jgi:DNA-binding beta-propeller fold protein YncE
MVLKSVIAVFFILLFTIVEAQEKLLVAVQLPKDSVVVFDLHKKVVKGQIKVGFLPHEIAYDPDSKNCYVSNFGLQDYDIRIGRPGNSIAVINPWSCSYVQTIYTTVDTSKGNAPHGVRVRPGVRKELYTNVEIGGDTMLVYDTRTTLVKRKFSLPKKTHNFIFSADGRKLWVMAASEGVFEVNPENGNVIHHGSFSSPIRGLYLAKNWIVASGNNEVFLLSKKDLHIIRHFINLGVGQLLYSAVTSDQKYILSPAVEENIVLAIDVRSGKVVQRMKTLKAPINVQVTKKFAFVSHDEDSFITLIDLKDFKTSEAFSAFGTNGLVLIQ